MRIQLLIASILFLGAVNYAIAQPKTRVLLLGTYHMATTTDKLKVKPDDIRSPQRQKQVDELLNSLQQFKPTKIFTEIAPAYQTYWDSVYTNWKRGIAPADDWAAQTEIFQIGIKLAHRLKIQPGVICVDWQVADSTNKAPLEKAYRNYRLAYINYWDGIENRKNEYYTASGQKVFQEIEQVFGAVPEMTLKDALLKLNSPDFQKKLYYNNNVAVMDKNPYGSGPTIAEGSLFRNLNIYTNIMHHITPTDERVLILYGAGHTQAFRTMFEGNPQIELVPISSVVKK